jgi:hypothetical protein
MVSPEPPDTQRGYDNSYTVSPQRIPVFQMVLPGIRIQMTCRIFPRLVSYNRFVELMGFRESTPLKVCYNRRIYRHKVFKGTREGEDLNRMILRVQTAADNQRPGEISHGQRVKQMENKKVRRFHRLSGLCSKTSS